MIKKFLTLLLTGLLLFSQVQFGFCATELDYMEAYTTDVLAQAAYVTDSGYTEVVDQEQTTTPTGEALGDESDREYRQAQSFILSGVKTVTAVELERYPYTQGTPTGNWTLRIETDNAGKPSGTLADANASIVVTPPAEGAVIKGTFATPFSLSASTLYHLRTLCDNQTTGTKWYIYATTASVYGDGTRVESQDGGATWTIMSSDLYFKIYVQGVKALQSYSESTIKTQGSYSLKGVAAVTESLNKTLTRTVSPTIDLSNQGRWDFYIYSSRTGSNIKLGIKDSGGTTTEITPNVTSSGAWQKVSVPLIGVANTDKDAINEIKTTVVNADSANTFYLDDMFGERRRQIILIE